MCCHGYRTQWYIHSHMEENYFTGSSIQAGVEQLTFQCVAMVTGHNGTFIQAGVEQPSNVFPRLRDTIVHSSPQLL